jgi:phage-related protein
MSVFTFTPDNGASKSVEPNVKVIRFADGYEQRVAIGMNTKPERWSLRFSVREDAEADAIESFLFARGAVESFDWTPPNEVAAKRFVCRKWSRAIDNPRFYTITAEFEQVFEP